MATTQEQIQAFKRDFQAHVDSIVNMQSGLLNKLISILDNDQMSLSQKKAGIKKEYASTKKVANEFNQLSTRPAVQSLLSKESADPFFQDIKENLDEVFQLQASSKMPRVETQDRRLTSDYDPSLRAGGPTRKAHPLFDKMDLAVQDVINSINQQEVDPSSRKDFTPQQREDFKNRLRLSLMPKPKAENKLKQELAYRSTPKPRPM